ncbi:MAG: lamin tail domain-containing protein [Pyrinomonadaceae bacterium]
MTTHTRHLAFAALILAAICVPLDRVSSQNESPRRVTQTPAESINLNPTLSGDGRRIVFESNAPLTGPADAAARSFKTIAADISSAQTTFASLAASRAPAPAVSQDGTHVAFASKDDPLNTNQDGNSEVFYFDGSSLKQITATIPDDPSQRASQGSFRPSISDDGLLVAFSSNRNLTEANATGNSEIFIYDARTQRLTQLTTTADGGSATDAKISGDGSRIAFLRATSSASSTARDLVILDITDGATRTLASAVNNITFAYGRAISDDGTRIVYSATTATNSSQVFLYDGRGEIVRQLTTLGSRVSDVPLHPTISGDGSRVAFATRRNVTGGNSDASVELYLYDIPGGATTRLTNAPDSATTEIVSSLNDDGSLVAFNFPRVLTEPNTPPEFANDCEIYLATAPARVAIENGLKIFNAATLGKSPAPPDTVAPDSIAIATGARLALTNTEAQRLPDGTFPERLRGTTVSVNDRAAQIFYVSPTQINFLVPPETGSGVAQVAVRNLDGLEIHGTVNVARAAPGIFTQPGNGTGEAVALDALTLLRGPFDALDANGDSRRLILFATGARDATNLTVTVGGRNAKVEAIVPAPDLPGLDQIHVVLSSRLKGAGIVPLSISAEGRRSNTSSLNVTDGGGTPRPVRVVLSPTTATIPIGGSMQYKAAAFDADDEEINGAPFSFTSDNPQAATISSTGLASGLSASTTIVKATSGSASASAQLQVVARTLVINEVLADPPDGLSGDANHDGTRSGSDDEFVELVNGTDADLDVSGWSLRTRALSGTTETSRHVFAAGTTILAGDAVVIFGGGNFDPSDPLFGGARVMKTSSAGLSLANAGQTILVRDRDGNLVTQISYGTADDSLGGDSVDQSVTRSPDITGAFVRHTTAAAGRKFSPGVKADNSFFVPHAGRLTRVELLPVAQEIISGETAQFTAQAFDHFDRPLSGVAYSFASSDANVAAIERFTIDESTGAATVFVKAHGIGAANIVASASDGAFNVTSAAVLINVKLPPPHVTRVKITPSPAAINRGGVRQFTADAFDDNNRIIPGATFTWSTSDVTVASIGADGAARGIGIGDVLINAATSDGRGGSISGHATLSVRVPLVINELLADVPPDNSATADVEGDANRDGTRSADDDEFIELLNISAGPLDISGLRISDATNVRYTIPANTFINGGQSLVVFGGGAPPANDPNFGGALVHTTSSLGLNDTGDSVSVKLTTASGDVVIASLVYGTGVVVPAPGDQSLTRSPDAMIDNEGGAFVPHQTTPFAANRRYSPGTRADGTPFNAAAITRIEVSPAAATIEVSASQIFNARAFGSTNGVEFEIPRVSFIWDSSNTGTANVSPVSATSTTARGASQGSVTIRARAGQLEGVSQLNVNQPPVLSSVSLAPATASINTGGTQQFNAQALDQFNHPMPNVSITFTIGDAGVATLDAFVPDTVNGSASAIIKGRASGTTQITATGVSSSGTVMSTPSSLTVTAPTPTPSPTPLPTPTPSPSPTPTPLTSVVISQIYGGGGNSGAPFKNDFIEIFNRGNTTVDLTNWSVQYAGATSTTWQFTTLSGSIAPGHYYLVKEAAGTGGASELPAADATGNINLSATAGKVALVSNSVALAGACPFASQIVDLVGYGSSANCFEGSAPTPAPSNTSSIQRASGGCRDTGVNGNDFADVAVMPRNSSSPVNLCAGNSMSDVGSIFQFFEFRLFPLPVRVTFVPLPVTTTQVRLTTAHPWLSRGPDLMPFFHRREADGVQNKNPPLVE